MTGKLRQLLLRKKTLAVVGVLIVLMVGVGVWLRNNSEWKRDKIAIAERLLTEWHSRSVYRAGKTFQSLTLSKIKIIQDGDDKFTVEGDAVLILSEYDYVIPYHLAVLIAKKHGEWTVVGMVDPSESLWDRIINNINSFLP